MKLPTKKKAADVDPARYSFLIYGMPKIGKTTLASSWPDALFLSCEPGTKGLEIYEIACTSWSGLKKAVGLLEEDSRFASIIIDTVDEAYSLCMEHVCQKLGIEHPGRDAAGREDFGKSWKAVRDEFTKTLDRLLRTGRGLVLLSHARENEVKTRFGDNYTRILPSTPGQSLSVIEALVDIILYCDYIKDETGKRRRVLICQGDEHVWAGYRAPAKFPAILPLERENGYEVIRQGFLGKHTGINIQEAMSARGSKESTGELLKTLQREKRKNGKKS